jgi:4-amino-4-deoxy-L-arabinose transferase-like glycosyltransferase
VTRVAGNHIAVAAFFSMSVFIFHIAIAGGYGYQRDELYFITCARHLAWGYVDQPPIIAVIAGAATTLFGQSVYALRLFPALAAALIVFTTGITARRLGGGGTAQGFAMLAVAVAPFYLAVGNLLTLNAFEALFWLIDAYLIIEFLDKQADEKAVLRRWIAFGVVTAMGVLTKYTMFFFAFSLYFGLLMTAGRDALRRAGPWVALLITLVLVSPNLWWQYSHGWPQLELLSSRLHKTVLTNIAGTGLIGFSPLQILMQVMMVNPFSLPLWLAGLSFFFYEASGKRRLFFWSYAFLVVIFVLLRAKVYYIAPIYPLLFAGGACALERRLMRNPLRVSYALALFMSGMLILPNAVPVLPLHTFLAYQRFMDLRSLKEENLATGAVPQQYADTLGWDDLVAQIAFSYNTLPPAQRARTAIWTENYGEAAAVDLLGEKYALPKAISGHNSYYLWGPRGYDGSSVIAVGIPASLTRMEFRDVRRMATFTDPYVLPQQNNVLIALCMRPREPLAAFWPRVKIYR